MTFPDSLIRGKEDDHSLSFHYPSPLAKSSPLHPYLDTRNHLLDPGWKSRIICPALGGPSRWTHSVREQGTRPGTLDSMRGMMPIL